MIISSSADYRAAAQQFLPSLPVPLHRRRRLCRANAAPQCGRLRRRGAAPARAQGHQPARYQHRTVRRKTQHPRRPLARGPDWHVPPAAARCRPPSTADRHGIPFTMSSVSVCPIEEVGAQNQAPHVVPALCAERPGLHAKRTGAPRPQAAPRWCSRWTCPCPAPATATHIRA